MIPNFNSVPAYNEATPEERRDWMDSAILFAIGVNDTIKCGTCDRTVVGSQFADREWDGHKYRVPIFDCACGESFGNWITEMVEAAELLPLFQQKLKEFHERATSIENTQRLLWLAFSNGSGYGDDGEMQWNCIDFKRGSITQIAEAIERHNLNELRKQDCARMIERIKLQLDIVQAADALYRVLDKGEGPIAETDRQNELCQKVLALRNFNTQPTTPTGTY